MFWQAIRGVAGDLEPADGPGAQELQRFHPVGRHRQPGKPTPRRSWTLRLELLGVRRGTVGVFEGVFAI